MFKPSRIIFVISSFTITFFLSTSLGWSNPIYTNSKLVSIQLSVASGQTPPSQMCFSNDNQSWSEPEPFSTLKAGWDLTAYGGGEEDGTKCIFAKVKDNNDNWSKVLSGCLTLDTIPPDSTASPQGGTYDPAPIVSLSVDEPATVYYTMDGSSPSTDSPVYSSPLEIAASTTLQFFALDLAGNAEQANTEEYLIFVDKDQDGLPDDWEIDYGLDPGDASADNGAEGDPDADGLSNMEEYLHYTHPQQADSEGDGINDGWEVQNGLDPLADDGAEDADGDGYSNYYEYTRGWDPQHAAITVYVDDDNNSGTEDGSLSYPFNTIQEAWAVVLAGDTIWVQPGVYQEEGNIVLKEGITLQGEDAQLCRLDLGQLYCIHLASYSTLSGFEIVNPAPDKSIIYAENISSAAITDSIIEGMSDSEQAAILLDNASVAIENNSILNSNVGIWNKNPSITISNTDCRN